MERDSGQSRRRFLQTTGALLAGGAVTGVAAGASSGPDAAFDATAVRGPDGQVEFDGTPTDTDGSIVSYDWTVEAVSGSYSTTLSGAFPDVDLPAETEYTVTLTVTDDEGISDTTQRSISTYNGTAPAEAMVGNTYKILNLDSGAALDVESSSTDDGADAQVWDSYEGANQLWRVEAATDGYYKLVNANSGKVLDVSGVSTDDGANVHQWTDVGGENQQWAIDQVSSGAYTLTARHSGKVAEAAGFSADNGTTVDQWGYGGGATQQWAVRPVDWECVADVSIVEDDRYENADGTKTVVASVTNQASVPVSVNPSVVAARVDGDLNTGQEDILLGADDTRQITVTFDNGDATDYDLVVGNDSITLSSSPYDVWA